MKAASCSIRWCGAPGHLAVTLRCCQAGAATATKSRSSQPLSVSAQRQCLGLFFHTDARHYIDAAAVASFLRALLQHLRGKVIVIWDGGSNHKGPLIRAVCANLPPLAPGSFACLRTGLEPGGVRLEPPQIRAPCQLHPTRCKAAYAGGTKPTAPAQILTTSAQTTLERLPTSFPFHRMLLI